MHRRLLISPHKRSVAANLVSIIADFPSIIASFKSIISTTDEHKTIALTNHFYLTIQGLLKAHVLGSYSAQSDQGLGVGLGLGLGLGLGSGLG